MNPLILTILTVIANAIITGIIVYLLQKKIEISFAKKMEEFKASLQYSNFEQQTKFAKIYEKRTETLETLHKKFSLFSHALYKMTNERDMEQQADVIGKLVEFWEYFLDNRLFMPDSLEAKIEKILVNAVELVGSASAAFHLSDKPTSLEKFFDELKEQTREIEKLYKSVADPEAK